ncbi:hypothetical protein ACQE98_04930 [Ornithinimicrobium sp. W1679]|uniref:hypothetical protein n=1 Tax=unclassified Ornithinimicrobium TaxID=2615080 RepID=UPI003CF020DD
MTELIVFTLGALVALALLGQLATPPADRLPPRRWTPVYLADRVRAGLGLFLGAGRERADRLGRAVDEHSRRRPGREDGTGTGPGGTTPGGPAA